MPWIRENVQPCESCDEATPHSRRRVALPVLLALALLVSGAWGFSLGETGWIPGVLAMFDGDFALLWDRERHWRIACEHCRWKRVAESRRLGRTFGGTTMVDPL
jgi:hypothetical protein